MSGFVSRLRYATPGLGSPTRVSEVTVDTKRGGRSATSSSIRLRRMHLDRAGQRHDAQPFSNSIARSLSDELSTARHSFLSTALAKK